MNVCRRIQPSLSSLSEPSLYFIPHVAILHERVLMDLLEIGAIAQVLGAVAILLSLIFIIIELR